MANNEKLYLGVNDHYYQDYELANAYFLATGNDFYSDENASKKFDIWVHDLIGLSIKKIVNMDDVSYEDFLRANNKLLAVRAYRERNNCTLREAKEAIDDIQKNMPDEYDKVKKRMEEK